jgi:hypothetical protein
MRIVMNRDNYAPRFQKVSEPDNRTTEAEVNGLITVKLQRHRLTEDVAALTRCGESLTARHDLNPLGRITPLPEISQMSGNLSDTERTGPSDLPPIRDCPQDHRLGEASGVRSSLVAGWSVSVGVVPPREEITKYFIA